MVSATQIALLGGALIAAGAVAKYTGAGAGLGELAEGSRKLISAPLSGTAQGITEISTSVGAAGKGVGDAINAIGNALRNSICFINPAACRQQTVAPPQDDRQGARPIPIEYNVYNTPIPVTTQPSLSTPITIRNAAIVAAREACPNCNTEELFTRAGGRPISAQQVYSGQVQVIA